VVVASPGIGSREIVIGPVSFDPGRGLLRREDGAAVELRPKAALVLAELLRHAPHPVSRAALLDAAWPEVHVTDDSLTQCVVEIRQALGDKGGALLRTLPRRGYLLDVPPAAPMPMPTPLPVLAVLPFENLARDARWDRLCDGLAEDLITDLAREPSLRVIARTSCFAWRGRGADVREIGMALGAGFVLEGSVQAEGGRVVVTAQLIDAASGQHVWAQRFAREETALFDIQAEVLARLVAALAGFGGRIAEAGRLAAARRPPGSLAAYELYLLGYEQEARLDRDGTLRAIGLLERAVAADPHLSRAWTVLGFALGNAAANGWCEDPAAHRARQRVAIERAVALDPEDGVALEELGAMRARQGDPAGAEAAFRRAAAAGANHADTLALLGKYMVEVLDEPGTAEWMTARAFALNPVAPDWYWLGATRVAFFAGDAGAAVAAAARAPALALPRLIGVLGQALGGDRAGALSALAAHRAAFGPAGVTRALGSLPPLCPPARSLLAEGLRAVGIRPAEPALLGLALAPAGPRRAG
jgi:TolB-like protein/DNA-binding winged helix-turn-helix (wHTH) protein